MVSKTTAKYLKISLLILLVAFIAYIVYISATVYIHPKSTFTIVNNLADITQEQVTAATNTFVLMVASVKNAQVNDTGVVTVTYDNGTPINATITTDTGVSVDTPTAGISLALQSKPDTANYTGFINIALICDTAISAIALAELQKFPKTITIEYTPAKMYTRQLLSGTIYDVNNKPLAIAETVVPALKPYEIIATLVQ